MNKLPGPCINLIVAVVLFGLSYSPARAQTTAFDDLRLIMARKAVVVEENGNVIQYRVGELPFYLIVDEKANRMRLMAPITEEKELDRKKLKILLSSNFDRALDAKYALSNGILWSVYTHPLRELFEAQVMDAFDQVRNLVDNYGTSYASTNMVFGGDDGN